MAESVTTSGRSTLDGPTADSFASCWGETGFTAPGLSRERRTDRAHFVRPTTECPNRLTEHEKRCSPAKLDRPLHGSDRRLSVVQIPQGA